MHNQVLMMEQPGVVLFQELLIAHILFLMPLVELLVLVILVAPEYCWQYTHI